MEQRTADQLADAGRQVSGELEVRDSTHVRHLRTFAHAHGPRGTDVQNHRQSWLLLGCTSHQHREILELKEAVNGGPAGIGRRYLHHPSGLDGVASRSRLEEETQPTPSFVGC
jgi:hypothetical protein